MASSGYSPLLHDAGEVEMTPKGDQVNGLYSPMSDPRTGDVLQFTAPIYFADRDEGSLMVDIIRIGAYKGKCSVRFKTEDGTATDGDDYEAIDQVIEFQDGEHMKAVQVKVIEKDGFETTEEFKLIISDPVNASMGTFLSTSRVKVCGYGLFPTQKYADQLNRGKVGIEEIGGWSLTYEYVKWVWATEGMVSRTVLTVVLDQLPNFYTYACLWTQIYIVDWLFNEDAPPLLKTGPHEGRIHTAYLIASIYFVPVFIIHLAKLWESDIDLEGHVAWNLRMHLIRKYLNYSDEVRQQASNSRLEYLLIERCNAAAGAYLTALKVFYLSGKCFVLCVFCGRKDPESLMASLAMPVMMTLYASIRAPILRHSAGKTAMAENNLVTAIQQVDRFFNVIEAYQKRPVAEENVLEQAKASQEAQNELVVVHANNEFLSEILAPMFIFLHILLHAEYVLDGTMKVGIFVTTISVFMEFSVLYSDAYQTLMKLSAAHGAIKALTEALCLPVDCADRKAQNRMRRTGLAEARAEILNERKEKGDLVNLTPATDQVDIKLTDVSYSFPAINLFKGINIRQKQGGIVAICGEHGCGKNTFMRILSGTLLPNAGTVFVPSHLRAVYVQQGVQVLPGSAWENMTYGEESAPPQRVLQICNDLRMNYVKEVVLHDLDMMGRLDEVDEKFNRNVQHDYNKWEQEMSAAEASKLQIARALVMSPEILIMQRPLASFNFSERGYMMTILKDYVRGRGYRLPEDEVLRRRPTSLFYTPTWREDMFEADTIWSIRQKQVTVSMTIDMSEAEISCLFQSGRGLGQATSSARPKAT